MKLATHVRAHNTHSRLHTAFGVLLLAVLLLAGLATAALGAGGSTPAHSGVLRFRITDTAPPVLGSLRVGRTAASQATMVDAAPSPTGRTPRLLWSAEQQAVWNRMRAENNAWWLLLKNKADRSATPSYSGGDIGEYAVIAYQITGDVTYARKAWSMITGYAKGQSYLDPAFFPEDGRNFTREAFVDFVWMYDWLYPALSASERTLFLNQLNRWGDLVLDKVSGVNWGTRLTDSDETVGHYFGLAFLDLATGPDNPRAGTFLNSTWNEQSANATLPVGGLTATASNLTSGMRNAVRRYVAMAEGGEWLESSEYNMNTMRLLLWGAYGVRTATGVDYFPEVSRYAAQLAKAQISEVTPDLQDAYQWGDIQEPRTLGLWLRLTLAGTLSGLLQNDPSTGPYSQQLVDDLVARYPIAAGNSSSVGMSFFLCYNPYAPRADWRGTFRKGLAASGYGFQFFHDGWGVGDSFFGTQFPTSPRVDHGLWYLNTFQLYRRGEWAITHPLGYQTSDGEYMNSMLIGGLSATYENKGLVAQEFGPADEYAYAAGTCGGQYYEQPYYNPPDTFLYEWTRSTLYLPSADKHSDTVIIFDRTNADNPKNVAKLDRYRASDLARIQSAPANKQWIIHSPVAPTLAADAISWTTAGGQQVRVSTLLPASQNRTVLDEKTAWTSTGTILDTERNFQTRITPQAEQRWDTFLNVVQAYDAGTSLRNNLVRSTAGEAEGVVVARGDHSDTLAMFSANTVQRVLTTGYALNWTANTSRTEAYFLDLAPAATWSVVVDGGASLPVTVSSQGVGRAVLSGVGPHTLRLAATAIQDTTAPAVPSGLAAKAGDANIALSWSANTDKDLAGYYLLRSDSQAGTYVKQSSAPISGTSLTQTGLQNGTTYWYRLSAVDQSGNESASTAPVSATPVAPIYSVSGTVTESGAPVANATVTVGDQTVTTSSTGTYAVTGLAGGTYTVNAARTGYTVSAAKYVTLGPSATNVNFTAEATAAAGIRIDAGGNGYSSATAGKWLADTYATGGNRFTYSARPISGTSDPALYTSVRYGKAFTYQIPAPAGAYTVKLHFAECWSTTTGRIFNVFLNGTQILSRFDIVGAVGPNTLVIKSFTATSTGSGITIDFQDVQNDALVNAIEVLPMNNSISGKVTAGGAGLAGVTISTGSQSATTGADGAYTLTGLAAGTYTLTASKTDYTLSAPRTATVGPDQTGVDFTATPKTFGISGAVRVNGVGLAGAAVSAAGQTATTAADGSYSFTGIVPGTYPVTATAADYTVSSAQNVTVGPSKTGVDFTATPKTFGISGAVRVNGVGLPGATVVAAGQTATTTADGSYSFTGIVPGTYSVTATAAEYIVSSAQSVTVGPSKTGVDFTAARKTYSVRGTVTAAGSALAGVTVTAGAGTATTAADGTYTVSGLFAGTYLVQAALPEYAFSAAQSVSVGPERSGVDFTATRNTYTVSGTVTAEGNPVSGVTVTAGNRTASTGADGVYTLTGLISGTYDVRATADEYTVDGPLSVTLGPSRAGVNFAATRKTYSVSGMVTVGGVGLSGVAVSAGDRTATTAANGSFILDGLISGTYSVSAARPEYTFSAAQSVTVGPSRTGVTFTGTPVTYQVAGTVWDGVRGLSGVTVSVGSRTATTAADGTYTVDGLVAGSYPVAASRRGFAFSASQSVTVGPSRTGVDFSRVAVRSAASFRLLAGRAVADGSALDLEFTANGATVTAAAFDLAFDPALVSFVSATAGALPAGVSVQAREQEAGRVRVVLFGTGTTAWLNGKVATVTFRPAAGAPAQVSAPVALHLPDSATNGVQVSDADGLAAEAPATGGTVTFAAGARGDLNRNGSIDVGDIQLLLNVLLGVVRFDPAQHDLNDNGGMDVGDVQSLVNLFLNGGQPASAAGKAVSKGKGGKPTAFRLTFNPGKESVTSLAFDLDLSGGTLASVTSSLQRGDLQLVHRTLANGRERVLLYSTNGTAIPATKKLFTVQVLGSKKLKALRPNATTPGGDGARADGTVVAVTVSTAGK